MKISFFGAVGTVTGSRYLLQYRQQRILVDCGLFQGLKELRQRNWRQFPVPASSLDAVILTHAHLDHSGYLPRLYREGFRGVVYTTPATHEVAGILLYDSAHLQEAEAERANRGRYSRHDPAEPLYGVREVEAVLRLFQPEIANESFRLGDLTVTFLPAGHILGAACVRIEADGKSLVFSGDVGRPDDPLMKPPQPLPSTDFLVLESTYGDRLHAPVVASRELARIVVETASRGGTLLVPAFAVGRAQTLLQLLAELQGQGAIPELPIYLDSPMAINISHILCRYQPEHRLDPKQCHILCGIATYVSDSEISRKLSRDPRPKIIIAGAGMLTGGRILHHLESFGGNPDNCLLVSGYQAAGTRGRKLLDGEHRVRLFGREIEIRCQVERLDALSGHADYSELGDWLSALPKAPRRVFLTHGEPQAALALKDYLAERLGWQAEIPSEFESVDLSLDASGEV